MGSPGIATVSRCCRPRPPARHLSSFKAALIVGLWFAILTLAPAVIGVWEWSVPLLLLAAGSFAVASLTAKSILVRITRPPPTD